MLGKVEGTRIITCHLGSGSSISAIKDGKIYDTSMGLTPLDGFMMGTRTGGFDPSAVTYIMEKEGLTPKQMDDLMNKKSGTLGISGVSSDDRDIEKAIGEGNERAKLAWDMRTYQITKIIGGYIAALGGLAPIMRTVSSSVISEIRAAQKPVASTSPTKSACSSVTESGILFRP